MLEKPMSADRLRASFDVHLSDRDGWCMVDRCDGGGKVICLKLGNFLARLCRQHMADLVKEVASRV